MGNRWPDCRRHWRSAGDENVFNLPQHQRQTEDDKVTTPPKDQEPTAEQAEQIEKAYQSYVQGNRAPWVEGLLSAAYVINRRTPSPEVARLTERVAELEKLTSAFDLEYERGFKAAEREAEASAAMNQEPKP